MKYETTILRIGTDFAKRRKDMDMSMRDVAKKAGVSASCVHDLEHGLGTRTSIITVLSIANALGSEISIDGHKLT